MQKLTHQELVTRQDGLLSQDSVPAVCVLNNIRSLYNVGSIFRTADGAGFRELLLCGITGIPPAFKISKTALGAEKTVAWRYLERAVEAVLQMKQLGYQIVLLEQTSESISYQDFQPKGPVCLVLGNEISGVHNDLLELADVSLEIEMSGLKNSLNVTVAFGIVAYDLRNKLLRKKVEKEGIKRKKKELYDSSKS